jgi:subtilisin family serine protease
VIPEPSLNAKTKKPRTWEPFLAFAVATSGVLLTGCMEAASTKSGSITETKPECTETAVPNSYVIHWKDSSVSVVRGWTRDEFEKEIFEPNKEDIRIVEQDQKVQISPLSAEFKPQNVRAYTDVSANAASDDIWGQQMISAPDAWKAGVLGAGVTVAVVDSGVDITHPQLAGRLATNTREIPANGIDDDDNGYIDDVHGWDFDGDQPIVSDTAGHGTHVSGIILAEHGASTVKGVAPGAKLLPLDFMNAAGQGNIGDAILAIKYAASQGVRVINASWGGSPCSQTLNRTIAEIEAQGVMFVAAAGNSGVDIDNSPEYPAAFNLPNQITVGASTARDYTAGFSNFSYHLVHLFAPGAGIMSTYPGSRLASLSGTSMAAPFVSGAAALIFSAHPNATVAQVRAALLNSVDPGDFAATSKGRLDIKKALAAFR